ncbi:cupin domain-containing protein [Sphingomonas sp. BIUV-7]|uniref:Cupin domain-containing protein n=1 Tax=Sphingomonas natans TaxID=3063330 RepID=A0ABT8Y7H4_9SPHN|nr:cupin domain-containing protein [Sphingomonas sp. BIUV-7]MDO6414246.1 cupin domain-containing protein [Sphingomonas sp. BIUV-7]
MRFVAALFFASLAVGEARALSPGAFVIETIAERRLATLPPGPLFWRIETLPTANAAKAAGGPHALSASVAGRNWLFTLSRAGGATPGATRVREIGPIPTPNARSFLLRINRAGGPPESQTPVHSHPGAEAIYVLAGQVTQRTGHGTERAGAGDALSAHGQDMAMQLTSSGDAPLDQLVMFVVDAEKPFSPAARFDD